MIADKPAADIGTDHNYLPAYLVQNGICPRVIASDVAYAPFANAKNFAKQLQFTDKIAVRLGQGLEVLNAGEVATIIIAGMGGYLIRNILAADISTAKSACRLVLQAQNHLVELRYWLSDNGWIIVDEQLVRDKELYYVVMAAEPGKAVLGEVEAEFGPCLLRKQDLCYCDYLRGQKQMILDLMDQINAKGSGQSQLRRQQLTEQINKIDQVLSWYFDAIDDD